MKVFLSYRRDDTSGHVGRLTDRLCARFGREAVFRDIDSIAPGRDFTVAINDAIGASDAVLAVIGRHWMSVRNADRRRRLDDPDDYVRVEIVAALEHHVPVIPLLFDGATMPSAANLPPPLVQLARRNALEVSDSRWDYDVQRLLDVLDPSSPESLSGSVPVVAVRGGRERWLRVAACVAAGLVLTTGVAVALLRSTDSPTVIASRSATSLAGPPTTGAGGTAVVTTTMANAPVTQNVTDPQPPVQPTGPSPTAPRPTNPPPTEPPPTAPPPTAPPPTAPPTTLLNADAVAGSWSGTVSDGSGGTFRIVLSVQRGCTIGNKCGSVYVSGNECLGDFIFYALSGGRYEFNVDNFAAGSGPNCSPGPGEYLTPQGGSTLSYTTNYGPSGTLSRS